MKRKPAIKRSTVAAFFDTHQTHNQEYLKNIPYARVMVERILGEFSVKPQRLLEIGAGQGRFSIQLAKSVKAVTATDISPRAIALLDALVRRLGVTNLNAQVLDAAGGRIPFKKGQFDAAVGFLVLHHIEPERYPLLVRLLHTALAPGSCVSFIEPNRWCPYYLVAIALRKDMPWEMEKGTYTDFLDRYQSSLGDYGFTVTRRYVFGFLPPFVTNRWPWTVQIDRIVERVPFLRTVLCPFEAITARRDR
jgi:SAM-dependent methyltransferase